MSEKQRHVFVYNKTKETFLAFRVKVADSILPEPKHTQYSRDELKSTVRPADSCRSLIRKYWLVPSIPAVFTPDSIAMYIFL